MPRGIGTYGSQVGRPAKKKKMMGGRMPLKKKKMMYGGMSTKKKKR